MFPAKTKAVANYFIKRGIDENKPITIMQLVKLVYFAYGWCLVTLKRKLIPDTIEAWDHGPVIRSIYKVAKIFGSEPITRLLNESESDLELTTPETKVLDFVWRTYSDLHAYEMSALTHRPGTPWDKAHRCGGRNQALADVDIEEHFSQLLKKLK